MKAAPPPSGKTGRRPRGSLNPPVIVEAAFAVAEREGLGGVTFQALGAELGAHPTAIYRHFRDKDELLLALVDALHAEVLAELPDPTQDWAADLTAMALKMHEIFLRHPAIATIATRTARREHEFRGVERLIDCMRRAGFSDADAARYYRVFGDFVLGYSSLDAEFAALDPETRAADLRSWDVEYKSLPPDRYPSICAVSHALPRLDDPDNFRLAVELMVSAIAHAAASHP
jgi:AcrR family transcriptional regulator